MIKRIVERITNLYKAGLELFKLHLKAWKHSLELTLIQDNLSKIKSSDIILFATMKNETFRLPYFLSYYKKLGVKHFIFVDNDSDDGMIDLLKNNKDITIFSTKASYKESNFGMHWLNYLLRKYGTGHWCITCDPDEFLVFPHIESRNLYDLTEYLNASDEKSFFCIIADMYSNKSIQETFYQTGDDPLKVCPYFDKKGYSVKYHHSFRHKFIQGGVRSRVFNESSPQLAPALNKVPLIKWKVHYAYVLSTHMAIPRFLNESTQPHNTTGVLLHFKFFDKFIAKVEIEIKEKQHWNDSEEYKKYHDSIVKRAHLYNKNISVKYKNWKTLEIYGLLNRGEF
jgi:hypothetical protein